MSEIPKKLYIKTYGCQMNVYDSDRMADLLKAHGYVTTDHPEEAHINIVNTCHIREKATEKTFSELGRLKRYRQAKRERGEEGLLVVSGCVAQAEGEEIIRRAPYVDVVIGPQSYHNLPEMIERARRTLPESDRSRRVKIEFPEESKFDFLPMPDAHQKRTAFLSIQEGCDKFCTYCVVPYTRGAEFSRPAADILKEAKHLVQQGVREITLLGQNVTAYHGRGPQGGEWGIDALCLELATIKGLERIRYTTSHPRDMTQALADAHRACSKLMPFLHLPVQSGSDSVLKRMNRQHTAERYREIIHMFREAVPSMGFSSDFIVGFPGESDKDFEATLGLVRHVRYAQAFSFKYSPRPGTPASAMDFQVLDQEKDRRLAELQSLLTYQQMEFNASMVGSVIPVLFEKQGTEKNQYIGKSPHMQGVHVYASCDIVGHTKDVLIKEAGIKALKGTLANA